MFEQPVTERQCAKCMKCKPMTAFRFVVARMQYRTECSGCELVRKAAGRERRKTKKPPRWPECDVAVIRKHFAIGGTAACVGLLPHHSEPAIRAKAYSLGVNYVGTVKPDRPRPNQTTPLCNIDVPLPAPHEYAPEDHAWMATRLPVYGGGFGAARISA